MRSITIVSRGRSGLAHPLDAVGQAEAASAAAQRAEGGAGQAQTAAADANAEKAFTDFVAGTSKDCVTKTLDTLGAGPANEKVKKAAYGSLLPLCNQLDAEVEKYTLARDQLRQAMLY